MFKVNTKIQLLELISQGAVAITPNNRLSSSLLSHYFAYCDHDTLIKPQCLPYTQTLIQAYDKLRFTHYEMIHPSLFNELQCRYLWQTIIQETPGITYNEGLVKAVMQAWKLCEQWQIDPEHHTFSHTPQTQTFQLWWQTFNQRLNALNGLHEYQLVPYLLKTQSPLFKTPVVWVCFDEFTPQQMSLHIYLEKQGIRQYSYDLSNSPSSPELFAAENIKEEYQQLIQWLHFKLEQGEHHIGVVVPELQQESRAIQRLLLHHFDPSLFNISLGESLSDYPLVAHALTWLQLDKVCTSKETTLLLQSPYIKAAPEEFLRRSQFLQDSAIAQQPHCTLQQLSQALINYAPKLSELLTNLSPYPASASPQEWVVFFQNRLNSLGFPGDYGLNSAQYQCYQRFVALFDEFRQLALIRSNFSMSEALNGLTQLARSTIFQAQKKNAPIQISGLLEASGCEFDSLWILGLSDHCLPAKTKLSAFIPPQLQRDLYMPHSTAARELHFAKQTLHRLQRGSSSTVFSYSKLQGDRPSLPSALIHHYPSYISKVLKQTAQQPSFLTTLEEYLVPLKSNESITGGTALLANQAKCPFKAFAEHRLVARPLPQLTEGIDNKERGKTIHRIMELLWQHLQNQNNLLSTPQEKLEQLIEQTIQQANNESKKDYIEERSTLLQEIEYTRLKRLVLGCLEWEKQRPSFAVAGLEQSYSINLSGLDIKVRVDRLDKVADKTWVIDYKSTLPTHKPWNEDRPQEPQLLLYALLDEDINTLLFMQVKTGNIFCQGLSEEQSDIKGISTLKKDETWPAIRDYWQHQLTTLTQEIFNGHCLPQPVNSTVCSYCEFKNLCRIQ
jgi:ATP-dependent helicase/nuclease subunit B